MRHDACEAIVGADLPYILINLSTLYSTYILIVCKLHLRTNRRFAGAPCADN